MIILDKFFSLLASYASVNRLLAPPLAVLILFYSGIERDATILAFIFALTALAPYVVVVTGVSLIMRFFDITQWSWLDTFVPASSLLFLPMIMLVCWLATHLKMEIKLKDDQITRLPPESSGPKAQRG